MTGGNARAAAMAGVLTLAGCQDRPVSFQEPARPPFTTVVPSAAAPVSKIDILFDVQNTGSMFDAQPYLQAAVTELLDGLVDPPCIDPTGATAPRTLAGACPTAARPAFPPVRDIHVGVVTTSLGTRLGNACSPTATAPAPYTNVSAHDDDEAHLVNRTLDHSPTMATEGVVPDTTAQDPFLYWYPSSNAAPPGAGSPVHDATTFTQDAVAMVGGAGYVGCGLTSPLESWYRFLVQPDPYASLALQDGKPAWVGVDAQILRQRRDFLRPDSAVLVVVVSDREDREIDVRSLGGTGYHWMDGSFDPPRGTRACATTPGSPGCQSCAQGDNANTDANCMMGPYASLDDWGFDLGLRTVHMKQKYGVDAQFPIQRYVNGLSSATVPDRCGEYGGGACSQPASSGYVGQNDCQNPLFAGKLPDGTNLDLATLCHSPPGRRTKDLVFYAHIGGVPSTLLHFDPTNLKNSVVTSTDWTKILGADPLHYDTTGIDPHMIEDYQPRPGIPGPGSANDADPVSGHDWITNTSNAMPGNGTPGGHILSVDLQYACIYPLTDTMGNPAPRDCTLPENASFCACPHATGGLTAGELPPVCDQTTPTEQVAAKAYPTIRELLLAKLMGQQGIVGSLCPVHTQDSATGDDPLYGYRPAVAGILGALTPLLGNECIPQQPKPDPTTGLVPCAILVQMPTPSGGTCTHPACDPALGLSVPAPDMLTKFCTELEAAYKANVSNNGGSTTGLTDPATISVCALEQLTPVRNPDAFQAGSCAPATQPGWCYVTGSAAGRCPQRILFTSESPPEKAITSIVCTSG